MSDLGNATINDAGTQTAAAVDGDRRLAVNYKTDFQRALDAGDAYSWHSSDNGGAGIELLAVQNLSETRRLHITKIILTNDAAATAGTFSVHLPGTGTPTAGNAVTGKPLNTAVVKIADALAMEDDQTAGNVFAEGNVIAEKSVYYERSETIQMADGSDICILGEDQVICVHSVHALDLASCEIIGYYKDAA